jgi:hypothetical protein
MMIDALNAIGPVNLELIHLDEPRERAYWAHALSLSEDELAQIVNRVGPRVIDVRRPPDEWTVFQRAYGCEAVANSDPTIEQLRCPDGRSIVRAKLAEAADKTAARRAQADLANNHGPSARPR